MTEDLDIKTEGAQFYRDIRSFFQKTVARTYKSYACKAWGRNQVHSKELPDAFGFEYHGHVLERVNLDLSCLQVWLLSADLPSFVLARSLALWLPPELESIVHLGTFR